MAKRRKRDKAGAGAPAQGEPRAMEPAAAEMPASSVLAAPAAPSRARPLVNAFIALFLAYQVAMPLRYYLGGRGYDERFSWRMFSTLRLQDCKVEVEEVTAGSGKPVNLSREVQIAWTHMLERYRRPVVDKFLARQCDKSSADELRYVRRCTNTDGSALPETVVTLDCKSRAFTVTGERAAGSEEASP